MPTSLTQCICSLIENGVNSFITGGARGFDTVAAETVLRLRNSEYPHIRLQLALPCADQTRGWSSSDKMRYDAILEEADDIQYISRDYTPECMMKRNRYMVDNSRYCVFYLLNTKSGTYKTVSYAMEENLELINILDKNKGQNL